MENRPTRTSWNSAGFRWYTRTRSQGGRGMGCPGWLCQLCSGGLQSCAGTDLSSPVWPWIKDLLIHPDQVILQSHQIQYGLHIFTYILQSKKTDLLFPINKGITQISAQDCGCLKYSRWKSWMLKPFPSLQKYFKVFSILKKIRQLCKTLPAHFWREVRAIYSWH